MPLDFQVWPILSGMSGKEAHSCPINFNILDLDKIMENNYSNISFWGRASGSYDSLQFTEMVLCLGKDYQPQSFAFPTILCYLLQDYIIG